MPPGGRIPPDGRQARPPGVGKYAKRHDLERPKTPGLDDPSIQYGDVQMLEAGQRVLPLPKRTQPPARPRAGGGLSPRPQRSLPMQVPDPIEFASRRLAGTLDVSGISSPGPRFGQGRFDTAAWTPIIRRVANAPGSSGLLRNAFVAKLGELARAPAGVQADVVDFGDLTDFLEGFNRGL